MSLLLLGYRLLQRLDTFNRPGFYVSGKNCTNYRFAFSYRSDYERFQYLLSRFPALIYCL